MPAIRVYIAENDKTLQRRLCAACKQQGYEVGIFDDGYPIVAMADNWPDVFLIDIELPGINGLEICKWLKSHEDSRAVPVVFISGESYLRVLAASVPADGYIEKPVKVPQMLKQIEHCLAKSKASAIA